MGRKKRPFYRMVVLDSRKRRDGAYLANLGFYNPFSDPHEVQLHDDEIIAWLQKGAMVSDTARSLLRSEGVLYKFSLLRQGMDAASVESKMSEWHASAEAKKAQREQAAAAKVAAKKAAEEAEAKAAEEAEAKAAEEAQAKAAEEAKAKAAEEAKAAADAKAAEEAAAAEAEGGAEAAAEAADETGAEPENDESEGDK
jgi:small subunit ribosomal protein S16